MAEHTTRERIEAVERLRAEAVNAGSPGAVERQHARGKLLARERIELLLDPGSFTELDAFVQHRSPNFNMMENRPYGDGVVTGHMFITGPEVVKTVTGEEVSFEELGGATAHATRSGVAHFTAPDEKALFGDCRYLLSFLPQSSADPPPWEPPSDPPDRMDAELDTLIPDEPTKPYDMHEVIRRVVDDGEFMEVQERFADNIVCGFARLGGY